MSARAWLRAVRARFLLASVIGVGVGLMASLSRGDSVDPVDAGLTLAGVLALHASVDLFNDYWDHRRRIDANTVQTPFSGGTGVIRDGSITPKAMRTAAIAMMAIGTAIGAYFVLTHGPVIALILGFAVASVYFYSTRIVNGGLGEVFVAAKGALITVGTSLIQSGEISGVAVAAGICVGILSSLVLFVTSFPDYSADKLGGRRTLVVVAGPKSASSLFWAFPGAFIAVIVAATYSGVLPATCAIALAALPFAFHAGRVLRVHHADVAGLIPAMRSAVLFGRVAGILLIIGLGVSQL